MRRIEISRFVRNDKKSCTLGIKVYDVSLVMCEQALEKALKALYIAQTGKMPPRIHAIEYFANETRLRPQLDEALLRLQELYIQLRYPDVEGPMPYERARPEDARQILRLTKDALKLIQVEIQNVEAERK